MAKWYRTGTVNVTNGSASVTGVTTAWLSQVKQGDEFLGPDGKFYEVSVDPVSNTALTLETNYTGTTVTGQAYAILRTSTAWSVVADLSLKISNFLQSVVSVLGGTGAPSSGLGADGSRYFRSDVPEYYTKASGAWSSPISLVGPQGPVGPGFSTTSTTNNTIGTGSKTFTVPGSGTSYLGSRMRSAITASPTNYLEGVVTAATSTSVTITSDLVGGSGTSAAWSLVVTGNKGDIGPAGPGSTGTSTTSLVIGTGTKTLATQAGLNLIAGQRVRFADQAAPTVNFMEGSISSYTGTSMSVSVDTIGGSGTIAAWNIGVIGSRGLQGIQGIDGPQGVAGASYAATSTTSLAIATGSKTFTTQAGLAYVVGSRVRAADSTNPANYMEGVCTAYATTSLTLAVDKIGGSGTVATWTLSLAGDVGSPGTNGTNGTNGVSFTSRGAYSGSTSYVLNDVVLNQNSSWIYINSTPSTGNAPPTLPTASNTWWQLAAQKGADGTGAVSSVNGQAGDVIINIPTRQTFTADGTWTKPSGCRAIRVSMVGGGGGGAGATAAASNACVGGGGGAGIYADALIDVTSVSSYAVVVGAAGAAGAAANGNGGAGGTSSIGSTVLTAPGGGGGVAMASGTTVALSAGGIGATGGTGGDYRAAGSDGGNGFRVAGSVGLAGYGGASAFGGSVRPPGAAGAGRTGVAPGSGGSGANSTSATGFAGGAGAPGIVNIDEYY